MIPSSLREGEVTIDRAKAQVWQFSSLRRGKAPPPWGGRSGRIVR